MLGIEVKNQVALEQYVTDCLLDLGVPAHIKGYHYLRRAIMIVVEDPSPSFSITKLLYPMVAKEFTTTPSRVERAMRHAIEISWLRADHDKLEAIFRCTVDPNKGKPTNGEYISMLADRVRLHASEWNVINTKEVEM